VIKVGGWNTENKSSSSFLMDIVLGWSLLVHHSLTHHSHSSSFLPLSHQFHSILRAIFSNVFFDFLAKCVLKIGNIVYWFIINLFSTLLLCHCWAAWALSGSSKSMRSVKSWSSPRITSWIRRVGIHPYPSSEFCRSKLRQMLPSSLMFGCQTRVKHFTIGGWIIKYKFDIHSI